MSPAIPGTQEWDRRLAICESCQFREPGTLADRCGLCGCFLAVRIATSCPGSFF